MHNLSRTSVRLEDSPLHAAQLVQPPDIGDDRNVARGDKPTFRRPDRAWASLVEEVHRPLTQRSVEAPKPDQGNIEALEQQLFGDVVEIQASDELERASVESGASDQAAIAPDRSEDEFVTDRDLVDRTAPHVARANELLASAPGPGEFEKHVDDLKRTADELENYRKALPETSPRLTPRTLSVVARELDRQIGGLRRRAEYLSEVRANATTSRKAIATGMVLRAGAAETALAARIMAGDLTPKQVQVLNEALRKVQELRVRLLDGKEWQDGTMPLADAEKVFKSTDPAPLVEKAFKQAGLKGGTEAFDEAFLDKLRNQPNGVIESQVEFTEGEDDVSLKSTIKPAATLGNVFDAYRRKLYPSPDCEEVVHATNLNYTELRDENDEVLFAGLRHGVHSAYGITAEKLKAMPKEEFQKLVKAALPQATDQERQTLYGRLQEKGGAAEVAAKIRAGANLNRATEVVQARIVNDPAKLQKALAGEVIEVDLTSISLLTPDKHRGGPEPEHDNERLMLAEQTAAYRALSGQPQPKEIALQGPDGSTVKVTVRVNVETFNFGVNAGGFARVGRDRFGGWDRSTEMNAGAIANFLGDTRVAPGTTWSPGGRVGKFIADQEKKLRPLEMQIAQLRARKNELEKLDDRGVGDLDQKIARPDEILKLNDQIDQLQKQAAPLRKNMSAARDLAGQIRDLWNHQGYKSKGVEPYKIVTRIAVLADLVGDTPVWNCKSGKDRTGQLDVEAKFLAWQINRFGRVPEPDHVRSTSEKAQLFQMMARSGNLEVQRRNTGFPGFKLFHVEAVQKQLGDALAGLWHQGVSKKVKT